MIFLSEDDIRGFIVQYNRWWMLRRKELSKYRRGRGLYVLECVAMSWFPQTIPQCCEHTDVLVKRLSSIDSDEPWLLKMSKKARCWSNLFRALQSRVNLKKFDGELLKVD